MRTRFLFLVTGCVLSLPLASCQFLGPTSFVFQPLEFPLGNSADIVRMAAFAIPNWSDTEPHNGTDLIVDERLTSTRIISPTAGVVTSISTRENPYSDPVGQLIVAIEIRINAEWTVYLVLEPSTVDPAMRTAQLAAIMVSEGQEVAVGTPMADLLIGTLGYPHLHYMVQRNGEAVCAYAHSSDAARAVLETVAALPGSSLPDGNICYGEP
jgi:murein DD-endopeptidase MepM/ murein hydrolase activator NlpD